MVRIAWLLVIALCGASAFGGSIFDDDYVPPKVTPMPKPKPEPQPAPVQAAPPATPTVPPSPGDSLPSNERPPLIPPAESRAPKESPAPVEIDPLQAALVAAKLSFQKAEHLADEKLSHEMAYTATVERERAETQKGVDTKAIDVQLEHMRDDFLAKDTDFLETRRYFAMLTRLSEASPRRRKNAPPIKTAEELREEIADAITQHALVEGMSFVEACKSARKPFELVSKEGKRKTYNWILKGRTGSHQVTHHDFRGRTTSETVVTYGIIGHVQGVFEDDYLTSFARIP